MEKDIKDWFIKGKGIKKAITSLTFSGIRKSSLDK